MKAAGSAVTSALFCFHEFVLSLHPLINRWINFCGFSLQFILLFQYQLEKYLTARICLNIDNLFIFSLFHPPKCTIKSIEGLEKIFFHTRLLIIYLFILHSDHSFPLPLNLPFCLPTSFCPSQAILCFCSERGRPQMGIKKKMTHQVAVRLSTFPCIKAGQSNPV